MAHVLVLGGGFGGLAAANELRRLLGEQHRITVVDRSDRFFMGFAKLWDLAGVRSLDEGTASLRGLERRGIDFVQTTIRDIDPQRRVVRTADGELSADAVVVALGAVPSAAHRDLLAGDHAHDLYDADHLDAMKRDLAEVRDGRVVVAILGGPFKCPPAPYEGALLVDQRLRDRGVRDDVAIALSTPQAMTIPAAGVDASRYVADHLSDHGVELLADHVVEDVDADGQVVRYRGGREVGYSVLLGVPANEPPAVVRRSDLVGASGWVEPDPRTLRTEHERVYAVGDCTQIPTATGQLPKAGVFAAAEGEVAARNVAADLVGGDGATFDGHGACFLELPGEQVAVVEGDFYADPPDVQLAPASHENFRRKQAFERDRIAAWLG